MADRAGLEFCTFLTQQHGDDCNSCENPPPGLRVWASISRGETTEVNEYICARCVPHYYRSKLAEWASYSSRKFEAHCKRCERQWIAEKRDIEIAAARRERADREKLRSLTITDTCVYSKDSLPNLDAGGYLEKKHGELCLRMADALEALTPRQTKITRTWARPVTGPFDTNLYPTK